MSSQLSCPIKGVRLKSLFSHRDHRGSLTEVFRACWEDLRQPVQWSVVHTTGNVVRGVHVHIHHVDYIVAVAGSLQLGLSDLREESPTYRIGCLMELNSDCLTAVEIPTGVAHGFYTPVPNVMFQGATEYYDAADDLGCYWADPGLNIPWPDIADPTLSERDRQSGSLAEMIALRRRLIGNVKLQRRVA